MSQPSTRRSSQQGEVLTAQQQPASSSAGGGRDTSGFGHGALSPEEQYQKQAEFGSVDLAPDTFGRRRPPAFTTDSAAQQEQEVVSDVTTTRQPSFLEARVEPRPVNGASDSGGLFAAMRSASGGLGLGFGGLNRVTNSSSTAGDAGLRGALSDRYTVGEVLGRGAFGQVFKGHDTKTGEPVAIKQLSLGGIPGEALTGIMGEIDLLKALNHPNIVQYIGSFKTRSHLYIIMEYMEAGSLSSTIKAVGFGGLPEPMVAMYIIQVLAGLSYLHGQGVIHRDIKGANILTTKQGLVKLADFGVSSRLGEIADEDDPTSVAVVGTPYWMAPEVIEMAPVGAAADIWSVGCLALELLTGAPPYFQLQPMSALFRIVQDDRPPLPDGLSREMRDFLLLCFQKDPAKRPDANAMRSHAWLATSRERLESSWQDTLRGGRRPTAEMEPISAVVDATLSGAAGAALTTEAIEQPRGRTGQTDVVQAPPQSTVILPLRNSTASQRETSRSPSKSKLGVRALSPAAATATVTADASSSPLSPAPQPPPPKAPQPPQVETMLTSLGVSEQGQEWAGGSMAAWLESRELAPAAEASMSSPPRASPSAAHPGSKEIWSLIGKLGPGGGRGVPPVTETLGQLTAAVAAGGAAGRAAFLQAHGAPALLDLLEGRSSEVHLAALRLANEVAADAESAAALALAGLVPSVARFADPRWPDHGVRAETGRYLASLAAGPPSAVQLLCACQGLATLTNLVDNVAPDGGALAGVACDSLWAALQAGGPGALVARCRAAATAGLPMRLVLLLERLERQASLARQQLPRSSPTVAQGPSSATSFQPQHSSSQRSIVGLLPPEVPTSDDRLGHQPSWSADSISGSPLQHANGGSGVNFGGVYHGGGLVETGGPCAEATIARAADLLLVMAHADTDTKLTLARKECLLKLVKVAFVLPPQPALQLLRTVKTLTADAAVLLPLYDCGLIQLLEPFLAAGQQPPAIAQALEALANLTRASRTRQEAAAVYQVVPHLVRLAQPQAQGGSPEAGMGLRERAIPMLCTMAHSTTRGRAALMAPSDGASVFLNLLLETPYQALALDALAAWLAAGEAARRLEARLATRETAQRLTALLAPLVVPPGGAGGGNTQALEAVLVPLARLLKASSAVEGRVGEVVGRSGLPPLLVELLRHPRPAVVLPALEALNDIYKQHQRPKDFLLKWPVQENLKRLMAGGGGGDGVLVRGLATALLNAFRVNTVF